MVIIRRLILLLLTLLLGGCQTIPFDPIELSEITLTPERVLALNSARAPLEYTVLSAFTFKKFTTEVVVSGYLEMDSTNHQFRIALLNPLGIKALEISGNNGAITEHFMIERLTEIPDLVNVFGTDIYRMYFDNLPSQEAEVIVDSSIIEFVERRDSEELHYLFGGKDHLLLEKRFCRNKKRVCTVRYFDYKLMDGRSYPGGMVLDNHRSRYRVVVSLKEVMGDS